MITSAEFENVPLFAGVEEQEPRQERITLGGG
jgi:hypothetical protein